MEFLAGNAGPITGAGGGIGQAPGGWFAVGVLCKAWPALRRMS